METKLTLDDITGILGIGSLEILGIFIILHRADPYLSAELRELVGSASWGIIFAVPFLVLMYIVGLLTAITSDMMLGTLFRSYATRRRKTLVLIANSANEVLRQAYSESERHQRLLKGSSIALIVLSFSLVYSSSPPHLVKAILGALLLCMAAMCPYLAVRSQQSLDQFTRDALDEADVEPESHDEDGA